MSTVMTEEPPPLATSLKEQRNCQPAAVRAKATPGVRVADDELLERLQRQSQMLEGASPEEISPGQWKHTIRDSQWRPASGRKAA